MRRVGLRGARRRAFALVLRPCALLSCWSPAAAEPPDFDSTPPPGAQKAAPGAVGGELFLGHSVARRRRGDRDSAGGGPILEGAAEASSPAFAGVVASLGLQAAYARLGSDGGEEVDGDAGVYFTLATKFEEWRAAFTWSEFVEPEGWGGDGRRAAEFAGTLSRSLTLLGGSFSPALHFIRGASGDASDRYVQVGAAAVFDLVVDAASSVTAEIASYRTRYDGGEEGMERFVEAYLAFERDLGSDLSLVLSLGVDWERAGDGANDSRAVESAIGVRVSF